MKIVPPAKGGLPCPVIAVSERNVTCNVPRQYALIRAEYWALPWGREDTALPAFEELGEPSEGCCTTLLLCPCCFHAVAVLLPCSFLHHC